jgi:hypothetical protein
MLGSGSVEFELATSLSGEPSVTDELGLTQSLAVHAGIAEWLDAGVSLAYAAVLSGPDAPRGLLDPFLDVKACLAGCGDADTAFGFRLDYAPPQDSPLSVGHHRIGGIAVLSLDGAGAAAHVNFGIVGHAECAHAVSGLLSLAVELPLAARLSLAAEVMAQTDFASDHPEWQLGSTVGAAWSVTDGVVLSTGVGALTTGVTSLGWLATAGITVVP